MRGKWLGLWAPAGVLLAALGCSTQSVYVPPPSTDEVHLPPDGDPRFYKPTEYPENTLNQPPTKKSLGNPQGAPPSLRPGGMGGAGMGGPM
jgi:hypothetical protein